MYEGRTASETLIHHAVSTAVQQGLYEENRQCLFYGTPALNPMYQKSTLWEKANAYAQFGQWWEHGNSLKTYNGLLNRMGVRWPVLSFYLDYDAFMALHQEEVDRMPQFPAEGSIQLIDGVVVFKISHSFYTYQSDEGPGPAEKGKDPSSLIYAVEYGESVENTPTTIYVSADPAVQSIHMYLGEQLIAEFNKENTIIQPEAASSQWVIPYTFEYSGAYYLSFCASCDQVSFSSPYHADALQVDRPHIIETWYEEADDNSVRIYVVTNLKMQYLSIDCEGLTPVSFSSDQAEILTYPEHVCKEWRISYAFPGPGTYTLNYSASADGTEFSEPLSETVQIP